MLMKPQKCHVLLNLFHFNGQTLRSHPLTPGYGKYQGSWKYSF